MGLAMKHEGWHGRTGPVKRLHPGTDLDGQWVSESSSLRIESGQHEELRVRAGALLLGGSIMNDAVLIDDGELFGDGSVHHVRFSSDTRAGRTLEYSWVRKGQRCSGWISKLRLPLASRSCPASPTT